MHTVPASRGAGMRWAGWFLLCSVACGGGAASVGTSDGGSGDVTVPDGGTDGGPVSADCSGLVPPAPGAAITFDITAIDDDQMCVVSRIDGEGVIAASARSATKPQWVQFDKSGIRLGTFDGPGDVFAQPQGFIGLFGQTRLDVIRWKAGGDYTPLMPADAIGPRFNGGVVALSADSSGLTVARIDAALNEIGSATVAGTFTARGAAEDASGAILALTGSGTALTGFWVDLAKGSATETFPLDSATSIVARPLLRGGIALQLDGRWTVVPAGDRSAQPAPSWLGGAAEFAPARGGKAYAVVPRSGNVVGIVTPEGNACGSVTFPGVSSVSVGSEGTVVGSTGARGCTKFVWRGALR
jgi:hypothetical protein